MKVVIFKNDAGSLSILRPIDGNGLTVEQIAVKDVPAGVPFRIIDESDLPEDTRYQAAWTADFSAPDGVGLGDEAWRELTNASN